MVEVVRGHARPEVDAVADRLAESLETSGVDGTLYLGYPVLASADESIEVDALLLSETHGLVAFLVKSSIPPTNDAWSESDDNQDRLTFALQSNLGRHQSLRDGRQLAIEIHAITVLPFSPPPRADEHHYASIDEVGQLVATFELGRPEYWPALRAALQRVTTIRPTKRRTSVRSTTSKGAFLKEIEKNIADLDSWQQRTAIESPEGVQRIRGLAGSGKTVVLSLKAAYLHSLNPEWTIAVTFHSQSLYGHLSDLINRFTFEHLGDFPDSSKLRLLHAWGSTGRPGIYSTLVQAVGGTLRDFGYARAAFGRDDAFGGVCRELLAIARERKIEPIFDAVLIDEAQDLPSEFFELVYMFTKGEPNKKRVYYAYDELQSLSEIQSMPSPNDLFGYSNGKPLVDTWDNKTLRMCYRNPPASLTLAHGLGLGIGYANGPIQHFDDPTLWSEIGYEVIDGQLELGHTIELERAADATPPYFSKNYLDPSNSIRIESFDSEENQAEWVAAQIATNLHEDEVEFSDILVVLPNALTARRAAGKLAQALNRRHIPSHLAGVTTSRDEIFTEDSIAIAHIHRSKGNEAPIVYVINSHECYSGAGLITKRNTLFTAITRSKAWVNIVGWGTNMQHLASEAQSIIDNNYQLRFKIPTYEELQRHRVLHRDQTPGERQKAKRAEAGLKQFLKAVQSGVIPLETLPPDTQAAIRTLMAADGGGGTQE